MKQPRCSAQDFRVLEMIDRAAKARQVCPTNNEICGQIGWQSSSGAANAIRRLEAAGIICVTRFQNARVVEILATGLRTVPPEWSTCAPHHRFRDEAPR